MTSYFAGAASDSALGAVAWPMACALGAGPALLAGLALFKDRIGSRR